MSLRKNRAQWFPLCLTVMAEGSKHRPPVGLAGLVLSKGELVPDDPCDCVLGSLHRAAAGIMRR